MNESWIWSLTLEGKMKIKFRQQPLGGEVVGGDGLFTLYSCIMCIHYLLKSYSYIYSGPSSLQKDVYLEEGSFKGSPGHAWRPLVEKF